MKNFFKKYISIAYIKGLLRNRVIQNLITVSVITLLIKGMSFYKETLVASSFGLSEVLDTFYIAFLIPGFISTVFIGSFKQVFIPNYVVEQKTGNNIASFQATGFLITAMISLVFMLIAYLFTDVYLETFFSGHTPEYYSLVKSHFYYGLPCIMLWGLSSLMDGLLNIKNEFRLSSFAGIFTPISIITCLFLFSESLGDTVLAFGTLIGAIGGFIYLWICCLWKKVIFWGTPNIANKNVRLMLSQVPAKVSSGFLSGMTGVVDQYFAAQLIIGSIAAINYGRKVPFFLSGLLVIAITNVLLPYFSKAILEDKKKAFDTLFKILKITAIGGTLFAIGGIIFSDYLVELFYQRNEFTVEDAEIVSTIQKVFLIYLPFAISGMVIVNFLTSINKNVYMAYVSFGSLVLNIILDFILIKYYGVLGIAICTTVVIIIKNFFLFGYTFRLHKSYRPI